MNVEKLKKSKEYSLVFTNGKRVNSKNFNLQVLDTETNCLRVGITASKKIGNATKRNFVKRRMRSLIDINFPRICLKPKDYVLVAKKGVALTKFESLSEELNLLLKKIEK